MVLQLQASVEGSFDDGHLPLIHQADNIVGVFYLVDEASFVGGPPSVDGYLLAGVVAAGRVVEEGACETEAVAVVGAHDAAVLGGFFSDNQIGACHRLGGEEGEPKEEKLFLHCIVKFESAKIQIISGLFLFIRKKVVSLFVLLFAEKADSGLNYNYI